jgi:hypothetical protein
VGPIQTDADFDVLDLRAPSKDAFPPDTYVSYLQNATIHSMIGAQTVYQECSVMSYQMFEKTGDGKPALLVTRASAHHTPDPSRS